MSSYINVFLRPRSYVEPPRGMRFCKINMSVITFRVAKVRSVLFRERVS